MNINLIQRRLQSHFNITNQRIRDNIIIQGYLTCCDKQDFEVYVNGEIKYNILSKPYLLPKNDRIIIEVRCKKCGKVISVFDNSCDGYDSCNNHNLISTETKHIHCKKCLEDSFSISVKYEYPNLQDLNELGIKEVDNAYTWIWITLKCNKCGTKYKNFVDYETA